MKKWIFGVLGFVVILVGGISYILLTGNNESEKQDSNFKVSENKTVITTTSVNETSISQTTTSVSEPISNPTSDGLLNKLSEVQDVVKGLNQFDNGNGKYYQQVVDRLSKLGITVDESTRGGFGMFDTSIREGKDMVFAGYVNSIEHVVDGNKVTFNVKAKSGYSPIVDGESWTARQIQESLKSDGNFIDVVYVLTINEDGKSGNLIRASGDWW